MFPFNPAMLYTVHQGVSNPASGGATKHEKSLSPTIWSRVVDSMLAVGGFDSGLLIGDNFATFNGITPANTGTEDWPAATGGGPASYGAYIDATATAGSIIPISDEAHAIRLTSTSGADVGDCVMWSNWLGRISSDPTNGGMVAFETRVKNETLGDKAVYTGFGDVGIADGATVATAATMDGTNHSFIGFKCGSDDTDGVDFVFSAGGSNAENQLTNAAGTVVNPVHNFTADEYVKLGFVFDPQAKKSEALTVYVNGVANPVPIPWLAPNSSSAIGILESDGTDNAEFPDGDLLRYLIGVTPGESAAHTFACDWWAAYFGNPAY